jgi:hypothetical protein
MYSKAGVPIEIHTGDLDEQTRPNVRSIRLSTYDWEPLGGLF